MATAATWPVGIALTAWDYMWRSTPLHRDERHVEGDSGHAPPDYPVGVDASDVQAARDGHGPLFHRTYSTVIREAECDPEELMARLSSDLNGAAPTTFARFQKVLGADGELAPGDEYVVRMPGPWDGPVRVVDRGPTWFRLATLAGHLEAGQIEFRVAADRGEMLRVEIESWARSSGPVVNLLYHRLRMAKEIQFHMWISFLEGVVALASGRMTGGIRTVTHRVEAPAR